MTALFTEFERVSFEQWLDAAQASLRGRSLGSLVRRSDGGIDIHALSDAADLRGIRHHHSLPGQYPYARGTAASGYRHAPWLIAQHIDIPDPREFNRALKDALANGQNAIVLNDALQLKGPGDLRQALEGIDLPLYPVFIQSGRSITRAAKIYDWLRAERAAEETRGLSGCVACDPLGILAGMGVIPLDAFEQMAARAEHLARHSPQLNSIVVDTAAYHEAGADAVQQLAIALATGAACFRELSDRGHSLAPLAKRTQVSLRIGENFFLEVAKFRAIKPLWAQMTGAFGIVGDGQKARLHARSGIRNKTRREPHVNLLRQTTEALAAALGGIESIAIAPFDEPSGTSDAFSRRLARNIQLILQEELQLTQLIDPAGGSWHIEKLTDQLARRAWAQFQRIEARGGLLACLKTGTLQAEIEAVAEGRRRDMAGGEAVLVGCNQYANPDETPPDVLEGRADPVKSAARSDAITVTPLKALRLAESFETAPAVAVDS